MDLKTVLETILTDAPMEILDGRFEVYKFAKWYECIRGLEPPVQGLLTTIGTLSTLTAEELDQQYARFLIEQEEET